MTQAILLTPIAPNGVFDRSLVLAPTETLRIDILEDSAPVVLETDGWRHSDMPARRCARSVEERPTPDSSSDSAGSNFYGRARRKLRLADPPVFMESDTP